MQTVTTPGGTRQRIIAAGAVIDSEHNAHSNLVVAYEW
jgi:hypothetical protein